MTRFKKFIQEEKAAAQMIEAAIIYPIVFLIIFLMIYLGLYILQAITVGAYAQKIAMLASREVSSPGYYLLLESDKISNSAIEMDVDGVPSPNFGNLYNNNFNRTNCDIVYRYWPLPNGKSPLNNDGEEFYTKALQTMVEKNSIIVTNNKDPDVKISCENNFVAQYITVTVDQELMHFGLLDFFGIEQPTVSATAKATVSDTDELVRNVDFAADALSALADKLGIDVSKAKSTVKNAAIKLGLYEEP